MVPEIAVNSSLSGTEYVQASAVAAIVEKHTPMRAFAEPTRSHVSAMPLFQSGDLDFIFVSQSEMHLANRGAEYYAPVGPTPMRVVAAGTEIMFGLFTTPDSGIERIEDLAGRKVMWDTKTVGVFYWAGKHLLDYYDLHDAIVSIPSPAPADRAEALKAGQVDAYACSTQYQAMEIIHSSVGMRMLDIPPEAAEWVHERYPALYPAMCPAGYNGGMVARDVPVLAASTALQARADLDDDVVYQVLAAIYDHFDEFSSAHPGVSSIFRRSVAVSRMKSRMRRSSWWRRMSPTRRPLSTTGSIGKLVERNASATRNRSSCGSIVTRAGDMKSATVPADGSSNAVLERMRRQSFSVSRPSRHPAVSMTGAADVCRRESSWIASARSRSGCRLAPPVSMRSTARGILPPYAACLAMPDPLDWRSRKPTEGRETSDSILLPPTPGKECV